MKRLAKAIVEAVTARPWTVMAVYLALTVVFAFALPRVEIDTDPENMLSSSEPVRVVHEEMKKDFALYDMIVVGVVPGSGEGVFTVATLERVAAITDGILMIEGVVARDLISPTTTDDIEGAGGVLTIEPLLKSSAIDEAAA